MKKYDYSILETLRLEIAATIFESQVLFEKIIQCEKQKDAETLSGIGFKLCAAARKKCDDFEIILDEVRRLLEDNHIVP